MDAKSSSVVPSLPRTLSFRTIRQRCIAHTVAADLSPHSIFVTKGVIKLNAFPFSAIFDVSCSSLACYLTPFGDDATQKPDVFAFGMIVWELFTRERPFQHVDSFLEVMELIARGERPPLNHDGFDNLQEIKALVAECWHASASERPTFEDIVTRLRAVHR